MKTPFNNHSKKLAPVFAAAVLALGIASAQTALPVVKVKAGATLVEIAQLANNDGAKSSTLKLLDVISNGSITTDNRNSSQTFTPGNGSTYLVMDGGVPSGWSVRVSSSQKMREAVARPGYPSKPFYDHYLAETLSIQIPQGTAAGQYVLKLRVQDSNTGFDSLVPITVQVVQ